MAFNILKTPLKLSWPWWRYALTALSTLAFVLSMYLSWHNLAGGPVIGCNGGSSCDQVLSSRWSMIGGVLPVSGLAMGAYLAMLGASLFIGQATEASVRRLAWSAMLVLAGAAAGSAIWFTILQEWFIGAFCPYCMTTHITGVLLAALVIWQAPIQFDEDRTDVPPKKYSPGKHVPSAAQRRILGRLPAIGLALAGIFVSVIMAVSQVVFTPAAVYLVGESPDNLIAMDTRAVPLVGSPDAPYMVNLLFDYQCSHCQQLHFMLEEAIRRYNDRLAFVLCPTPLSSQCNPYVAQDAGGFEDSCELARVAMAVWIANREVFPGFDHWMFLQESGDRWTPRSLDAARAKAIELVGQTKFETALDDSRIDQYLQASIRMYGQTGTGVPKMVYGSRWVIPQPYDVDDLVMIMQNSLGVPMP